MYWTEQPRTYLVDQLCKRNDHANTQQDNTNAPRSDNLVKLHRMRVEPLNELMTHGSMTTTHNINECTNYVLLFYPVPINIGF